MKVLKIIFSIIALIGFVGMLGTNEQSPCWYIILLSSFALFLVGCGGVAFTENRYFVYGSLYAIISIIGATMYPFMKQRKFPRFCRTLLHKCGGSYSNLFNVVKNRYLISLERKGVQL